MADEREPTLREALDLASDEAGLQPWYRSCVEPLLGMPRSQWPRCCGGGCEPCADVLCHVAVRTLDLVKRLRDEKSGGRT